MDNEQKIVFHKSEEKGKGLPFGILECEKLFASEDLFEPSLRNFHVIFWFKKGTGKYYVDFEEYKFKPNTVVLLSKDQVSYFEKFDQSKVEMQSIVFNPEFIYRNESDLSHLFQFTVSDHIEGVQILELRHEEAEVLQMISNNMKEVYDEWSPNSRKNAFYHWLSLFLIHVERMQSNISGRCEERIIDDHSRQLLEFNQLLETNFRKEYKVEFYLEEMGVTVKALSKLTKDRYKLSPKSVIDERRVLELKRQLKATANPVKNIAYDLGFDEPTNMVKYFKKHTGLTPNAFREASH